MLEHHTFPGTDVPEAYGPYSHAVVAGDFVFVAGQIARDSVTGKLIDGDITAQTTRCIEIIRDILAKLDLTLADVVRVTVYLNDLADFEAMNRVYREFFPSEPPTRSTVVVAALVVPNARVEIECMAAMPKQ